jgi:uncharacterized protein
MAGLPFPPFYGCMKEKTALDLTAVMRLCCPIAMFRPRPATLIYTKARLLSVNPGVPITLGGKPVESMELRPDSREDRLTIGDLTFFVHASGKRYAIRVKDKNSELRKNFKGLHWYPVNEAYRFNARFVAYPKPREVEVKNMLGDRGPTYFFGYVAFTFGGKEYRLDAEDNGSGGLFIVFRDLTSKKDTYQAARFLDADPPKDGYVEIDFNKAYNPPCAYNPYATCPLPTARNRLPVEIPAGEKRYH